MPSADTIDGLRDHAILAVELQAGFRWAEITALTVGDLRQNRGLDTLSITRKGGLREALAIHPQVAARIRAYLDAAGHGSDHKGPIRGNAKVNDQPSRLDPSGVNRIFRKHAAVIGLDCGYSADSMRATFITTALENGAQLEEV